MIQAIVRKGKVLPEEVPAPVVGDGSVLVRVASSCISAGTEIAGVEESEHSLIRKSATTATLGKLLEKVRTDGVGKAYAIARQKLRRDSDEREAGRPTGYSIAGTVIEVGGPASRFKRGDRVAAAGAGIANHAEFVNVPENLCVRIPAGLDFRDASTVTLGAIALQGVRRADLKLGEIAVVFGTGILGLLTVQLLRQSGVRVIALDIDDRRLAIAAELGAERTVHPSSEDPIGLTLQVTGGFGADAVLFTASTGDDEPLSLSFRMCKRKGRVVLVGVAGMNIHRQDLYAKELDLRMSTSYGPGRYDRQYEETGLAYPYAYVRWTENRNMSEYLRLLADGAVRLDRLVDRSFPIERVTEAVEYLRTSPVKPLMVFLTYPEATPPALEVPATSRKVTLRRELAGNGRIRVGLIGAGQFATAVHLPNLRTLGDRFEIRAIATRNGHRGKHAGETFGAGYVTTSYDDILGDDQVDLVVVSTRHATHAPLVLRALEAGKHVFVEKPLAINREQLESIAAFYERDDATTPLLMVGFNRRFSPYCAAIKHRTDNRVNPLYIRYRVNAGSLGPDHWVFEEGGRVVGEACHIVDLMTYFTGARITGVSSQAVTPRTGHIRADDNRTIVLEYDDGSLCSIDYFSTGHASLPKEYMEVHFDQKSIVLDDYRAVRGYGVTIDEIKNTDSPKGHRQELEALHAALTGESAGWPIPLWDMVQTTSVTFLV